MKKSSLFKGLTGSFGLLLPLAIVLSALAFSREGDINNKLGISASKAEQTSFSSPYSTREALRAAEEEYEIRAMAEGSVLLRNENNALPLAKKKVTLFGNASVNPSYHGGSGGPSNTGVDLYTALKKENFSINETVYKKIKDAGVTRGNGNIGEVDPAIYSSSDIGDYKDAAIVTICRYGGEENDMDLVDKSGVRELSLHEEERQMLEFVNAQGFEKVIVLLNSGYALETAWLEDYCDAALWIAFPGTYGFEGVAKLLTGETNPSGRLVDVFSANTLSNPAMPNFGNFSFADLPADLYHDKYVVYAEGIYSGYKYYETRYFDLVQGLHNADSTKGAKESVEAWDYASEVAYPFGFGLSYGSWKEELTSLDWNLSSHVVEAKVKVKNTSPTVTGKHSVLLYATLPYESGQAQKSAIQLVGFSKTADLAPGEEETLTISVDDYLFATYDDKATNGADNTKKGCYVFDKGDYYFSIGLDSHDAINNVLATLGVHGLYDHNGLEVIGDPSKVAKKTLDAYDNLTHAKSRVTGEVVSNRFQDIDVNNLIPNAVTYLTRDDWNTFPDAFTGLKADDDASGLIRKHMTARSSLYQKPSDAPDYSTFKYSQEVTIKFYELADFDWDDPRWETFIDQLTPAQLSGFVGEGFGNKAMTEVGFPSNSAGDGPDGLQIGNFLHPSETLAAASYNLELLAERGRFLAYDALDAGYATVYGGGCNLHRTPYSGRNFEYYSEDANLSYYCGRAQGAEMSKGGLVGCFKHFLGNDQETNRHGVATFMSEQTLRQGDARAFEGALTEGGSLGNMGSYNRVGVYSASDYKALMTDLLRKEWGFKGISITDSSKDATSYIFTADAIDAGTTQFNNDATARPEEAKALIVRNKDGNIWKCLREQAKYFFYAYAHSNAINGLNQNTEAVEFVPWWKNAIYAIDGTLIGLTALSAIGYVVFLVIEAKKKKEVA